MDQVILAVGQATDLSFLDAGHGVKVNRNRIAVDPDYLQTAAKGIYAGGDITRAPGAVIDAIADGRKAAAEIDPAQDGSGDIDEVLYARGAPDPILGREEGFAARPREKATMRDPASRIQGFDEIEKGFSDRQAVREAGRCLQCDLRLHIGCNSAPPEPWLPFDAAHVEPVPEAEGVFKLLDADHHVLCIQGTANLRQALSAALKDNPSATRFAYEQNKLFTRRETELIQKHLQQHGRMPGGAGDALDDLY